MPWASPATGRLLSVYEGVSSCGGRTQSPLNCGQEGSWEAWPGVRKPPWKPLGQFLPPHVFWGGQKKQCGLSHRGVGGEAGGVGDLFSQMASPRMSVRNPGWVLWVFCSGGAQDSGSQAVTGGARMLGKTTALSGWRPQPRLSTRPGLAAPHQCQRWRIAAATVVSSVHAENPQRRS